MEDDPNATRIDSSVHIGDKAIVRDSAVGAGASHVSRDSAVGLGAFILAVLAGLISNAIWGWWPYIVKLLKGL